LLDESSARFDVLVGNPPYIEDRKYDEYQLEVNKSTRAEKESDEANMISPAQSPFLTCIF